MQILRKPIDTLTPTDVTELWWDQVSEGTELELKSDLPSKAGPMKDPWYSGGAVGDYARNQIAEEIIAFANTLGGIVCIGINETKDHPKRADSANPVPRVHELARRLRQAIYGIIDPPLAVLEACGIVLDEATGAGVVLIRVPQSRRRPHRHSVSKDVFVRRSDESAKVSMREVQELTLHAVSEATQIDAAVSARRAAFLKLARDWHSARTVPYCTVGFHMYAVPTTPLDLGRVVGRPALTNLNAQVRATLSRGGVVECVWPYGQALVWNPGLRSISAQRGINTGGAAERKVRYSLQTNGVCETELLIHGSLDRNAIYATWLAGGLGQMLVWIETIRREAGVSAEYGLAVQLLIFERPTYFVEYSAQSVIDSMEAQLPPGTHRFPLMSVGAADEFSDLLGRFDEDLWNLAGMDVQRSRPSFTVKSN